MGLSGLSGSPQTKGSLVRFTVRTHASVADQGPNWECIVSPSLSPFFHHALEINKILTKILIWVCANNKSYHQK